MADKMCSVNIDISSSMKVKKSEGNGSCSGKSFNCKEWILDVVKFCKADMKRVIFSVKVGLAVLLASMLILFEATYQVFGASNILWSIITIVIMFEYTVGATFNRGFNRAVGSLVAGVLAIAVSQVALYSGHVAQPIIIGASIFLIGGLTSFMKLWPSLVPYEYGFRVTLLTFCLIIISDYRRGNPLKTAMERLYSIAIGVFITVLVNTFIFPIWAGEQLHYDLVNNFNSLADALEECVRKYLEVDDGPDQFSKTVMDEFPDEPAYKICKAALNSSAKLETLANAAKWEPPHGRFCNFFYPWSEYVKVGAVLRHCTYMVMALHGVLHSEIQAPYNLRVAFQQEIRDASNQAAQLVRSMGQDIRNMTISLQSSLLKRVHSSTERLQRAICVHSYLLTSSLHSDYSSTPLPGLSKCNSQALNDSEHSAEISTAAQETPTEEAIAKQQHRKVQSWPPREMDELRGYGQLEEVPAMRALESTAALSLATFTSLLIEFVARLDHLVQAVNALAKMAKFKHETVPRNI
ncbi:hypothetical protein Scep_006108 [Stephania cephalantha]|uniref:Aluminum-activated malate transporter n=1 Tax=Stephania cephalantha TaxID=152367 RepID=A0AAP0K7H6_9MAGN